MWKWLSIVSILIVISLSLTSLFLWQFSGLQQHLSIIKYLDSLSDPQEREVKFSLYFGSPSDNLYGGTLAFSTRSFILIWRSTGLMYFKTSPKTSYITTSNCTETPFPDEDDTELIGGNPQIKLLFANNFFEWTKQVQTGQHVYVENIQGVGLIRSTRTITANPQLDTSNFAACRYTAF